MNSKKDTKPNSQTRLIIFGLDSDTKPRAARFAEKDAEAASKAANQLNLKTWNVTTPPLPELLTKIPLGNSAAIGLAIAPKVSRDVFEAILKAATLDHPKKKETVPTIDEHDKAAVKTLKPDELSELERQILAVAHERQFGRLPENWTSIKEGSVVLVHQNRDDGWWEALVTKRQGNMLTLRWRDYPKQSAVIRHCSTVALMDPRAS